MEENNKSIDTTKINNKVNDSKKSNKNMSKKNVKPKSNNASQNNKKPSNQNTNNQLSKKITKPNDVNSKSDIKKNNNKVIKENQNDKKVSNVNRNKKLPNSNLNNTKKQNISSNIEKTNVKNVKKITNKNTKNSNTNLNKTKKEKVSQNSNSQKAKSNLQKNNTTVNKEKKEINNKNIKSNNKIEEKKNDNNSIKNEVIKEKSQKEEIEKKTKSKLPIFIILVILVVLGFLGIFLMHFSGNKIASNVYINNINVSNLQVSEAKKILEKEYKNSLRKNITYLYKEKEYSINLDDIEFSILIDEAVENAQKIGRNQNIFNSIKQYYGLLFGNTENINIEFDYDKEKLYAKIKEIENNFYQEVKQYTYVIEENKLKITKGTEGVSIEYEKIENDLLSAISNRQIPEFFQVPINIESPDEIDVEKIHSEVFVEVANAYYEKNPFKIYNEVKGVDFDKNMLLEMINSNPENQEYIIDLKITEPEITVDGLGLYNDVLGECRTYYVNNPNRTTNLRLAANKINGKILMPGESFSYNDVVGERTVAAGYRNAAIYVNGEVEDGLAGGICQISSTLYDAVVYANLQVDERYNHARVPSYVTAGRDATVYWGSKDFKFTNNREYPIKISITVQGGYATAVIHGMKTQNEYEISFASSVVSRYNGYMVVKTYKVYKQNGVEVKRELISTDSYKV